MVLPFPGAHLRCGTQTVSMNRSSRGRTDHRLLQAVFQFRALATKMGKKSSIVLVIGVLLGVLLFAYYIITQDPNRDPADFDPHSGLDQTSDEGLQEPSDPGLSNSGPEISSTKVIPPPAINKPPPVPGSEQLSSEELASNFLQANSAREAERWIDATEQMGIDAAKDWRLSLDTMCGPAELSYLEQKQKGEGQSRFVEKLSEYCAGYQPKYDILEKIQAGELQQMLGDRHQVNQLDYVGRELGDLAGSRLNERIKELVREARLPEDIAAIGEYLQLYYQETGEILWQPHTGATTRMQDMFISSLQATALDLYSCQRFGGCGPGSMKVIRICAMSSVCERGWNYEQFVFAHHSPLDMEYINQILNYLHSN